MISRAANTVMVLAVAILLGGCDWKSATPLLDSSDFARPAIAGKYVMTLEGMPDSARIVEKANGEFGLFDSGGRELVFGLAPLASPEDGVDLFLAQATDAPQKYDYFIVSREQRGILHVFLPVCGNTAPRFGIEQSESGACRFASRTALMSAAQDIAAEMRTARVRPSGFAILRPDTK